MHTRDAATIVLVRDGNDGLEVCLLRRSPDMVFAGGAHVFPGGAVDGHDRGVDPAPPMRGRRSRDASAMLGVPDGLSFWMAAVRECFEESGVLLARHADGSTLDLRADDTAARFAAYRHELVEQRCTLTDVCRREALVVPLDEIFYLSHWITPEGSPRRFDTRFFVAAAPDLQPVEPDGTEVVAHWWATPRAAVDAAARGDVELILPTARSLEVVDRFATVVELLGALSDADAADRSGAPQLVDDAGGRRRWLPGDPESGPVATPGPTRSAELIP